MEDLNRELSKTGSLPVNMSELGKMTHAEADVLRQISKQSKEN